MKKEKNEYRKYINATQGLTPDERKVYFEELYTGSSELIVTDRSNNKYPKTPPPLIIEESLFTFNNPLGYFVNKLRKLFQLP